jgi:uncharacterized protein
MIKKLFSLLLPKEDKFFRLIVQLAVQAEHSATSLKACVEGADQQARAAAAKKAAESRAEAKRLSNEVTRELCLTFITPFDREDIESFSFVLYKITKIVHKICDRLQYYDLSGDKKDFSRQTNLIVQEAAAMHDVVDELTKGHNTTRTMAKIDVLYDLENQGDMVLNELLAALYKSEHDARGFILRKDIYDMLETVIDRYRDAAAIALQIVLKHS